MEIVRNSGATRRVMVNSGRFQTSLKFAPSCLTEPYSWGTREELGSTPNQLVLIFIFLKVGHLSSVTTRALSDQAIREPRFNSVASEKIHSQPRCFINFGDYRTSPLPIMLTCNKLMLKLAKNCMSLKWGCYMVQNWCWFDLVVSNATIRPDICGARIRLGHKLG